jgi:hypothetical protein
VTIRRAGSISTDWLSAKVSANTGIDPAMVRRLDGRLDIGSPPVTILQMSLDKDQECGTAWLSDRAIFGRLGEQRNEFLLG